ncbi:zinc-ribbon domain-containing protein, partial [Acinetobacter baumannii]
MKVFYCHNCHHQVLFNNTFCQNCNALLGYQV